MSWIDYDQLPHHVKSILDHVIEVELFDHDKKNDRIKKLSEAKGSFEEKLEKLDDLFETVEKLREAFDCDGSFEEIVHKLEGDVPVDVDTTVADLAHEIKTAVKWLNDLRSEFAESKEKLAAFSQERFDALKEEVNEASLKLSDVVDELIGDYEGAAYIDPEELVSELAFRGVTLHYANPVATKTTKLGAETVTKPEHHVQKQAKGLRPARLVHVADTCHAVVRRMKRQGRSFMVAESWECIDEADVAATILDKMRRHAEAMPDGVQRRSLLRAVTCKDLKKAMYFWSQFVPDERFDVNHLTKP